MATDEIVVAENSNGIEDRGTLVAPGGSQKKLVAASTPNLEDLRAQIEVLQEVNSHLNSEIEHSTYQLDGLREERDAWKKRAQVLCRMLNDKKKEEAEGGSEIRVVQEMPTAEEVEQKCRQVCDSGREEEMVLAGVDTHELVLKGRMGGWLIEADELRRGSIIGEGAFGTTYHGIWRGAQVAVKCVPVQSKEDMISFLREVEALAGIRHPNILPFLGACIVAPTTFWLVCEYMPGGTLGKWLHAEKYVRRPLLKRLQYALEVAQGMLALERCDPPILHRDLKPTNIFIDGSGHARVGDFGLARRLPATNISTLTSETGTYMYMAPEMVRHEVYDSKADVWSWGVMLCELCTNAQPYQGNFWTPIQVAMAVADGKVKPQMPKDIHPALTKLAELCYSQEPSERPSFESVVSEMTAILEVLQAEANAQEGSFFTRIMRRASFSQRGTSFSQSRTESPWDEGIASTTPSLKSLQ
ncbi:unnamed protein product [Ostreobium quekettii]|uniref:Protein kinase domain-containing protein n=1 Tax=Ostreobium quekettii TaxID=121088 RepID=A0A8S1J4D1_9CHLO|nr:unnamed protein product [Ostreobium quekettii]|eukprot:evm.model.scf_1759.3 EVM.evm.TU.scf_1759.3   scf_1759:12276-16697(-)